ncbi:unnamed protein product [Allacma fusca]|uniref:Uncharacterized protein n=1 Tax=Allacma fusca TaxID=39272 RepID=A0A8J2JVQ0_9HEXA|nr:unnamed protein product [Allacma fusca]
MDTKPVDPYRFSQATLEDTQEDELNAILGELSALQMSLDQEIIKQPNLLQVPETQSKPNGGTSTTSSDNGVRTESPDNDSGFSDNASLLSSGSSLSASGSSSGSSTTSCQIKNIPGSNVLRPNEDEKAEKIREALAKMRAASVTRLYVKAFAPDGSSKALMVEESMSCSRVLALLADKNHVPLSHKWALVEHIPHLHMERIYEDHENMVENLLMWTRDSKNKIYFVERDDKYDMFVNPQRYFLENRLSQGAPCLDEHTKNGLIDEFFNQGVGVPDVETTLYLKAEGKKAWKKFIFVLRASGIYYYPKGRSNSSKDLVCLATIDPNQQTYQGIGWKKKFKAPTEFGFVLKPARLQVKSHRHMKYLCAEDAETLKLWLVGLRIAKHKRQLWDNYRTLMEDIAHEDLDRFGRSVSLASMPIQINTKDTELPLKLRQPIIEEGIYSKITHQNTRLENPVGQVSLVMHTTVPVQIVPNREEGFESDCPVGGTIKRKPSTVLQPKIPLTINTRSIVGDYISVTATANEASNSVTHTLQRRRSSSGNSGSGNSTASSNSSLSSINSQPSMILQQTNSNGVVHNSQTPRSGKPPLGTSIGASARKPPAPLVEEPLDFESLPPPPPELLMDGGSNNGVIEHHDIPAFGAAPFGSSPPPPPPPPACMPPMPPPPPSAAPYVPSLKSANSNAVRTEPKKKGVSFASELTQRLASRNNQTNSDNNKNVLTNPQSKISSPLNNIMNSNLSNPKKLDDPPVDFLTDLQRVMQKKWQVAQKCQVDRNTTPHEILGFRLSQEMEADVQSSNAQDENPGTGTENSNNVRVSAWVSQHYGSADEIPPVLKQQQQQTVTQMLPQPIVQQTIQQQPIPQSLPPQPINMMSPGQKPIPPTKPVRNESIYISTTGLPPPPSQADLMAIGNNGGGQSPPVYALPNQMNIPSQRTSPPGGVVIYENFQGKKNNCNNNHVNAGQYYPVQVRNKKPPPPIPKRADSTHLSAHIVFN